MSGCAADPASFPRGRTVPRRWDNPMDPGHLKPFLRSVSLNREQVPSFESYPFNLPVVRAEPTGFASKGHLFHRRKWQWKIDASRRRRRCADIIKGDMMIVSPLIIPLNLMC